MPLTQFQQKLLKHLMLNKSSESYLAGGSALHLSPKSKRFSNDLDFFHDSEEQVSKAFIIDKKTLEENGYTLEIEMNQPGYIRAIVKQAKEGTKIEWAQDSAWRFMPLIQDKTVGLLMHPIDLAVNKLLALAGRDEARDFLDIIYIHQEIISLGALCWATVGKDPGYTPFSLLEIIKRRGKYRQEDFSRLQLKKPVDLIKLKSIWLEAIDSAEIFIKSRPLSEAGCLYYSSKKRTFVTPNSAELIDIQPHFATHGGILPRVRE